MKIFAEMFRRRLNSGYEWDGFDPEKYRTENYRRIESLDAEILEDMATFYAKAQPHGKFLEVGAGSNMYPILAALPYAGSIDIWEYGSKNVAYLKKQCEVGLDTDWEQWIIKLRELNSEVYGDIDFQQQLRDKVTVTQGSIFDLPEKEYDNISMHSVAESLTRKRSEFRRAVNKFIGAGKPGATVVASFVVNSKGYASPGKPFPAFSIDTRDVLEMVGIPMMTDVTTGFTKAELREGEPLLKLFGRLNTQPPVRRLRRYRLR